MFNIYTYDKNKIEQEQKRKEKLKLEKYNLKRKSIYFNNNFIL